MRTIIILLLALACTHAKSQFQVEWFKPAGLQLTSFDYWNGQLLVASAEQNCSRIFLMNSSGSVFYTDTSSHNSKAIQYFRRDQNFLYEIGLKYKRRLPTGLVQNSHYLLGGSPLVSPQIHKSSLYGAFWQYVIKYDLQGTELFRFPIWTSGQTQKMEISDEHLYLLTVIYDAPGGIFKYDTLGNRSWLFSPPMFTTNFFTDPIGNCYVVGATMDGHDHIIKLNMDGSKIWQLTVDSFGVRNGFVKGDSIFICGTVTGDKGAFLIASSSGKELSRHVFDLSPELGNQNPHFKYIRADETAVYVAGDTGGQYPEGFVIKFSDPRFVSVTETSIGESVGIKVFPNPAGDEINLQLKNHDSYSVSVSLFDQLGRVIFQQQHELDAFNKDQIKLKAPSAKGVYFVKVEDGKNTYIEKVVFN